MKQSKVSLKMLPLLGGLLLLEATPSFAAPIAYNDFNGGSTGNVSNIGQGNSGNLVDYADGTTVLGSLAVGSSLTSSGGEIADSGTDMSAAFNGHLDLAESIYSPNPIVLTFSGLDSSKTYELVLAVNRSGQPTWSGSYEIGGADAFTNISSSGTFGGNPLFSGPSDSSTILPSVNQTTGYVAKFTAINPGADGTFTLTGTLNTGSNFYMNGVSLAVVPEPSSIGMLLAGVVGCLAIRRRARRR